MLNLYTYVSFWIFYRASHFFYILVYSNSVRIACIKIQIPKFLNADSDSVGLKYGPRFIVTITQVIFMNKYFA